MMKLQEHIESICNEELSATTQWGEEIVEGKEEVVKRIVKMFTVKELPWTPIKTERGPAFFHELNYYERYLVLGSLAIKQSRVTKANIKNNEVGSYWGDTELITDGSYANGLQARECCRVHMQKGVLRDLEIEV